MQDNFDKELREIDKRLEQKEVKRSLIERVASSELFTTERNYSSPPCSSHFRTPLHIVNISRATYRIFVIWYFGNSNSEKSCRKRFINLLFCYWTQHHGIFWNHATFSIVVRFVLQAEIKLFVRPDAVYLKEHFEKKLVELKEEKKYLQVKLCSWSWMASWFNVEYVVVPLLRVWKY